MTGEALIRLAAAETVGMPQLDIAAAMSQTPTGFSEWLIILPVAIPLIVGALSIMLRGYPRVSPVLTLLAMGVLVINGVALLARVLHEGPIAMTMGNWLPPFGISFAVDALGATLSLTGVAIAFLSTVYALGEVDTAANRAGFYAMLNILLAGVNGAFLTGDIFNLYVWFEVFLISSFGLIILGGERLQLDGAVKYCFLNLLATTMFLIATAYLYGTVGTLNMADLSGKLAAAPADPQFLPISLLLLVGFGMKAAAFPLYFWLPASYHTPKPVVSALFAGLLTKVGVYALLRTFTVIMPAASEGPLFDILFAVAIGTIVIGLFGALAETNLRRMLGYLLISGIGVLLVGLSLRTQAALSAMIFYTVHSMVVMTALYFLAGSIERTGGGSSLRDVRGLYLAGPLIALLFLTLGLALAGFPPLSGFWPKALLINEALAEQAYTAVAALILNGIISTIVIGRAWSLLFWRPRPEVAAPAAISLSAAANPAPPQLDGASSRGQLLMVGPAVALTLAAIALGLFPAPLLDLANEGAAHLLDPSAYIRAVLGDAS